MKKHQSSFTRIALIELVVVLLSGGGPLLIAYCIGGKSQFGNVLSTLLTSDQFLFYALSLLSLNFVLTFLEHMIYWSDKKRELVKFIRDIFSEVGNTLHVLFRTISGVLITFLLMWKTIKPETFQIDKIFLVTVYAFGSFFACIILQLFHKYLKSLELKRQ